MMENTRGWNAGAPARKDFEDGELWVISQRGGYWFVNNEDYDSYVNMTEHGDFPKYWKKFDLKISLPEAVRGAFIHPYWTQEESAEVQI